MRPERPGRDPSPAWLRPGRAEASDLPAAPSLVELSRRQSLRLLGTRRVGRLAVVAGGRPDIFPVNYSVADDGSVLVRTDPGTKLSEGSQWWVAFEVDETEEADRSGWSVVVKGLAFDVTRTLDPRSRRLQRLPVDSWAPGPRARLLAITPEVVTGRRLLTRPPAPAGAGSGS